MKKEVSAMLKKIMNLHEEATHLRLKSVCEDYGASVFPKIRLADVFPIEGSGISNEEYSFALQSHFDFILTDEKHHPLFAIEFDGKLHISEIQKKRDKIKNRLCAKFNFPILRINSNHLLKKYRGMDILSRLIEYWFLSEGFYTAQEDGLISYDEPFDLLSIMSIGNNRRDFPLWLSRELLIKIQKFHESKLCKDRAPSIIIGTDSEGNYRGISYLRINDIQGICAEMALRGQQFPADFAQLLEELIIYEIYNKLLSVLENKTKALPLSLISEKLNKYKKDYEFLTASLISHGPSKSI